MPGAVSTRDDWMPQGRVTNWHTQPPTGANTTSRRSSHTDRRPDLLAHFEQCKRLLDSVQRGEAPGLSAKRRLGSVRETPGLSARGAWTQCKRRLDSVQETPGLSTRGACTQYKRRLDLVQESPGLSAKDAWTRCKRRLDSVQETLGLSARDAWTQYKRRLDSVQEAPGFSARVAWT